MVWSILLSVLSPTGYGAASESSESAVEREPIAHRRIVKHFDFNERPLENYGSSPLHWRPFRARGFPIYLEGRFDEGVGHADAPSFRLDLDGGSVAYRYEGNDIAVQTNSDYLIVAWIRTEGLGNARAYLTASLLDRKGVPIPGTEQWSDLIGPEAEGRWLPIRIGLRGNIPHGRYIGLTLWLTQRSIWDDRPRPMHYVEQEEIRCTAWFDDITVYRLPRVTLRTTRPGNLFHEQEAVELLPEVTDPDGLNLTASLTIRDADRAVIDHRPVAITPEQDDKDTQYLYPELKPGVYEAELLVGTDNVPLVRRTLRFARLAGRINPAQDAGRGFGLVLDRVEPALLAGQQELLDQMRVEYVKLPVWIAQQAVMGQSADRLEAVDGYVEAIVDAGGDPVGMTLDDPALRQGERGATIRSMIDLMSEDPAIWKPLIASTWSRYAGLIYVWQLGRDQDGAQLLDHRMPALVRSLRMEMSGLMSEPRIAMPLAIGYGAGQAGLGDYRCIEIPTSIWPEKIADAIAPWMDDPRRVWLTLQPLDAEKYPRVLRLADLSRRLAESYFLGVGAVFVPALWDMQIGLFGAQVDPQEEYLIMRTVTDLIGRAEPVSRTQIGGQAEALVFDRNGQAVLFVWDPYAPPEGREHWIYLGEDARQVDLWGRSQPLPMIGDMNRVKIGPVPSFIINTPTWLVEFRRQFILEPAAVEATFEGSTCRIAFTNSYHEPISGILRLLGPPDWDVRPNTLAFALQPGQTFRQSIQMRFPINTESQIKFLLGEFMIDSHRRYRILTPAWFDLGLEKIDIETFAWRDGGQGIVRVTLTNRTDQTVHFDGHLIVPDRQRMTRLFPNILPGQSVTKEFLLDEVAVLKGEQVRVHFNERQGSRVWNKVLVIP